MPVSKSAPYAHTVSDSMTTLDVLAWNFIVKNPGRGLHAQVDKVKAAIQEANPGIAFADDRCLRKGTVVNLPALSAIANPTTPSPTRPQPGAGSVGLRAATAGAGLGSLETPSSRPSATGMPAGMTRQTLNREPYLRVENNKGIQVRDVAAQLGLSVAQLGEVRSTAAAFYVPLTPTVEAALLQQNVAAARRASGVGGSKAVTLQWPAWGPTSRPFRSGGHSGLDIAATPNSPIGAAAQGKVIFAGRMGNYGKCVEIQHPNGWVTRYAHCSRINVKVGQEVAAGEQIALIGNTGYVRPGPEGRGYHLHFEVRVNGKPENPRAYLPGGQKA
jgi:murein DD-endopeptidase MepM/ murein hydrolase activator NlpD